MSQPVLSRLLDLQEKQRVPDGAGGFTSTWTTLGSVWAELRPRRGRERAYDATIVSQVPYTVTVRGAPEGAQARPKADQRFRVGARVFRITSVMEADPDARFLICDALEEVLA
jgi:head-tail adaptor